MAIYRCTNCGEGVSTNEIHVCKGNTTTPFIKGFRPNYFYKTSVKDIRTSNVENEIDLHKKEKE